MRPHVHHRINRRSRYPSKSSRELVRSTGQTGLCGRSEVRPLLTVDREPVPGFEQPEFRVVPIYEYKCRVCDERFDVEQSFTDETLTEIDGCSIDESGRHQVKKVFAAPAIAFKGDGFYRNDARSSAAASSTSSSTSDTSSSDKSPSDTSSSDTSSSDKSSDTSSNTASDSASKSDSSAKSASAASSSGDKATTSSKSSSSD